MTRTSDDVIIQSPTSYTGATRRIWRMTRVRNPVVKWMLAVPVAILIVAFAWVLCTVWLVIFGIFLVPWRLLRRGSRKRKQEALRHQEVLAASRRVA